MQAQLKYKVEIKQDVTCCFVYGILNDASVKNIQVEQVANVNQ